MRTGEALPDLIRIACRELESFYLADLQAVEQALGLSGIASSSRPAGIASRIDSSRRRRNLKALTKRRYQAVEGSRAIGPCLDPENGRSRSFRNLVLGIRRLVGT